MDESAVISVENEESCQRGRERLTQRPSTRLVVFTYLSERKASCGWARTELVREIG